MITLICRHFSALSSVYYALIAVVLLVMVPTISLTPPGEHLRQIHNRDFMTVHTRSSPTTYYEGRRGPTGFEYELMRRFADDLGVSLNLDASHQVDSVLPAVREKGDLGAAGLPLAPTTPGIHFTRPILNMQPLLVYRRGLYGIDEPADLIGLEIGTLSSSGTSANLRELQAEYPELSWKESNKLEVAELMAQIENESLDAAVIYDHQFRLNRLFFPNVERGFFIGDPISMAWAVPSGRGLGFLQAANRFLENLKASGMLERLKSRYFGHDDYLEYVGTRTFLSHLDSRLPRYKDLFKEAARETGFDWKLLAALGYQESHWDPDAVSPTGVRGLMMLTRPTAEQMGIENRRDPIQSIDGGARYLRSVHDRLPESITGDDRLYMAMASYNVGLGHLYDARKITQMRGGNPDKWADVREALPLLQQREWHSKTRHGYARGGEPVIYVRNIRRYYEMIEYVERSRRQFFQLEQTTINDEGLLLFDPVPPLN
jgi:membrane-bound lytic murein transglycosylase F